MYNNLWKAELCYPPAPLARTLRGDGNEEDGDDEDDNKQKQQTRYGHSPCIRGYAILAS